MSIDRDRLAEAIRNAMHWRPDAQEWELDLDNADEWYASPNEMASAIAPEYDRLTTEWQARVRSVNLSSKAVPTRKQGGGK